jgi:hypothetical protein
MAGLGEQHRGGRQAIPTMRLWAALDSGVGQPMVCSTHRARPMSESPGPSKVIRRSCAASSAALASPSCPSFPRMLNGDPAPAAPLVPPGVSASYTRGRTSRP